MADERNWTSFNAGKMFYHIDRWKSIVPVPARRPH